MHAEWLSEKLSLGASPDRASLPPGDRLAELISASFWERYRDQSFRRLELVEAAAAALQRGGLEEAQRQQAEHEAHKLAGSIGLFGFARGSELARQVYELLRADHRLSPAMGACLSALLTALRRELERPAA